MSTSARTLAYSHNTCVHSCDSIVKWSADNTRGVPAVRIEMAAKVNDIDMTETGRSASGRYMALGFSTDTWMVSVTPGTHKSLPLTG
jgi:hypothetical protein